MRFVNLITKKQFHSMLLHDKDWNLEDDFTGINENEIDFEVYNLTSESVTQTSRIAWIFSSTTHRSLNAHGFHQGSSLSPLLLFFVLFMT